MYLHHNSSIASAGVAWPSADAAPSLNTKLPIADPHNATHHRISPASVTLVTGTYNLGSDATNFFNPQQLTEVSEVFSVPTGYGNQGSYVNVAVDFPSRWVEFGWQIANNNGPLVVSVDITKVSASYQVTWTASLGAFGGIEAGTPTVRLVSDAFTTCVDITRDFNSFPEPTTGNLSANTITLQSADIITGAGNTFTATWSINCSVSEVLWW
jgi:hypothetical protein